MKCPQCKEGKLIATKEAIAEFVILENGEIDWDSEKSQCCYYDKDLIISCNNCEAEISHDFESDSLDSKIIDIYMNNR